MNNDLSIMMKAKTESQQQEQKQVLAISYVPMQWASWDKVYDMDKAMEYGTVFPELNLPIISERGKKQ